MAPGNHPRAEHLCFADLGANLSSPAPQLSYWFDRIAERERTAGVDVELEWQRQHAAHGGHRRHIECELVRGHVATGPQCIEVRVERCPESPTDPRSTVRRTLSSST